jgi:hypothetical protein
MCLISTEVLDERMTAKLGDPERPLLGENLDKLT